MAGSIVPSARLVHGQAKAAGMSDQAEFIERAVLEDIHRAAPPALVGELGIRSLACGGAFVSLAEALPESAILINRTIGLGLISPATEADVQDIVAAYKKARIRRYFVHRHPHSKPGALVEWLQSAGLERARSWQKFERASVPIPARPSSLEVRLVGREHGDDFARIVCDAFDLGVAAIPWFAEIPGRPDWHVFMSFADGVPAGTGAIFVKNGAAWFDFGATAPSFRQRGSQSALLTRRIAHACELGCRTLLTCTGEAVPGDPQHSYRNLLKAGFRETSLRENYAPPRA
jgi:GNAT superfamily N-acetyltransferase